MIDGLRKPEYTGDNRCWPCTVLNASILFLACACVDPTASRNAFASPRRRLDDRRRRRGGNRASWLSRPRYPGVRAETRRGALRLPELPRPKPGRWPTTPTRKPANARCPNSSMRASSVPTVRASYLDDGFRADWREEMETVRNEDLTAAVRDAASSPVSAKTVENGRVRGRLRRWGGNRTLAFAPGRRRGGRGGADAGRVRRRPRRSRAVGVGAPFVPLRLSRL